MRNKSWILFVLLVMLASSCSSKKDPKKNNPAAAGKARNMPIVVEGFVVTPSTVNQDLEVPGNVLPYESTELHPEVSGRVIALNVKEGQYVKKGTLIAKLFDGDLQAQLKKLEVQLSISQKTMQRMGELLKIQGVSQQEYDLSGLDVNNIRADMDVVRTNIGRTEVRAPFNGRLGLKNISLGAYITPQTVITTIQQVDQLKLEFTIPEKYSDRVSVGQAVSFTIEGSNKHLLGKIMATESAVTAENRSLRVRAVVSGKDPSLIPGAFAKVTLDLGEDKNALKVPSQAIIPGARNKQLIIYRGGIATFSVVTTGVRDSATVQITSGLNPGDTIVTTGLLAIKPNAKIKISRISNRKSNGPHGTQAGHDSTTSP